MKRPHVLRIVLIIPIACVTVLTAMAADPSPPPTNPVPDNYHVEVQPANIALTPGTQPQENIQVYGDPRNDTAHPNTIVDPQDIDDLKKAITTNPEAQKAFAQMKSRADERITQPTNVPPVQKGPDGNAMWPGDYFKDFWKLTDTNGGDMPYVAMAYQLTGDQKYGEFVKQVLMAYADNYKSWGHPKDWTEKRYRSATDGRLSYQFLNDGCWLGAMAYSYDLIYNLPSWTPEQRAHIRDDLFKPIAAQFINPAVGKPDYLSQPNNRSAICAAGVLIAGYATDDQELINDALYGPGGTKDKPTGGTLQAHFGEGGILPDGLWVEGAPAYQTGIASCGLFNSVETLWHHGIDMYRFRGGALKRMLDSALLLAYPDGKMAEAALHDSGPFALLDTRDWMSNEVGVPYECGYRRYRDPHYIPIIKNAVKNLGMTIHHGPTSLFLDLPPDAGTPTPIVPINVNYYSVGYGVLRQATPSGPNQIILEYGVCAGHSHPSKLGIDLFALGQPLIPYPGVIFPYDDPRDSKWYQTTLGNSDLEIDERSQVHGGNSYNFVRGTPPADAIQLVYAPGATMGLERAWSNTLHAKLAPNLASKVTGVETPPPDTQFTPVSEDRSLFLTPEYLADIFGAFSTGPHIYDLAWHIRGEMTASLKADPFQFPAPVPDGYNALTNVTHTSTNQPWTAAVTTPDKQTVHFVASGGTPTDLFLGNGLFYTETPPVIIQRREAQSNVLFGNAVDISGSKDGFVKGVTQSGSLDLGYGLLKVDTIKGTDLCFTAFRPGSYTAEGMTTDGMQAMVRKNGANVQGLYLGGGTTLKVDGGSIARSVSGLAYVESTPEGDYIVGNPSPSDATVTVSLSALNGLKAYALDDSGKQMGPATVNASGSGTLAATLKAGARIELSSK